MHFMLNQDNQFSILQVLEQSPNYSQRDLAGKLGMSLGKANYCLKGLIDKGLVKVENFKNSRNKIQYAYLLTPQGMSEKSKLTLHFLQRKTEEYERLKIEIEQLKRQIG
ncbi:Transcriptional regulator, MarR family [bacterium endosymbiont of Bathymodiolus sp. 5 South]|jgi:EPS-associated MarR family transcriptional regulator|nr:Transcriptional regulator, MarR family [bacterium endosymbiont of Bathymodiolus sp. 5 South]VVH58379.1 Transcriptional regulator, MarR family [uncultured Gammaproteobacteria bacterium]VVH61713.1 Transcriptional regulator, MarR family [uncultured Gammaproteobacteria bacterium]VVM28500.1 Transcriptional regulator, MarR family [uncultured Gammaproteobacteria bacterium]